jgi:hypothetical protein
MAASDPVEQWRRLNTLYAEMGDLELLELRATFGDLTEVAQGVLRNEMKKRKLWDLPPAAEPSLEVRGGDPESDDDFFADLRLGGVIVEEYDTVNEAKLASYVLELAGVRAVVVDGSGQFDLRSPFVRVAPEDAEKAAAILAQPISEGVRADWQATQDLPDFEIPACPHCSCREVLLEAFEPSNQWLCEECGHRWVDPAPEPLGDPR